jgi:CHAT domain-containing protein/tetratricopeptide (TPR) repeat protein
MRAERRLSAAFFAILIVAGGLIVPSAARQQVAGIQVTALLDAASQALRALREDDALARVEEALALAEKTADRLGIAMSNRLRGQVLRQLNRYPESTASYQRALAEFEALRNEKGVIDVLTGLSATAIALGQTSQVREFGDRALQLSAKPGNERARTQVLQVLGSSDVYREFSAKWNDEVYEIGRRLGDDLLVGEALIRRANGHFSAGRLAEAKTVYEEGIQVLERTNNLEPIAAAYLSLGRVFRAHGDYDGAIQRYQKAIDILAPTKERYTIVEATNAKAIALGALGRKAESLASYEHGLALARESGNPRVIDFMEGNLAAAFLNLGQYDRAIKTLEAVIARKPERSMLGYRLSALAQSLMGVKRYAEALEHITEALRIAREFKQTESVGYRLDDRARILSNLGRHEEALADARESFSIVEEIRSRLVPTDFLKRGYGDRMRNSYAQIVDLLSHLGRGNEALEFAEQGRARAFLDLLAARETGAAPTAGQTAELGSTAIGQPINLAGIKQTAARLRSTLLAFWVNNDATIVWVTRPGAEPTHLRLPITRDRLTSLVAGTTAALRPAKQGTTTRGGDGADGSLETLDEELVDLPMRGLGVIALSKDDKAAWRELHKALIEPIRGELPRGGRLTIVPHGPLLQLSFAALQNAAGRYLIEDYELHYAPSISALEFTARRQQQVAGNATSPWAVIGNPAALPVVRNRPLPPLPGAAREMASLATVAPRPGLIRLEGATAGEAELSKAIATARPSLLHFATHGFVFDDPKQSPFLALNRRGQTNADDGRLTLDEVYGLRLDTDLVVLSACRTGAGHVGSDGVLGLTRGFFYAGAPSVLATYWDVVDDATARLMSGFYRGYVKNRAKGSSLRSAQLALLADLRAGKVIVTAGGRQVTLPEHPLLWAAFFLSGEP